MYYMYCRPIWHDHGHVKLRELHCRHRIGIDRRNLVVVVQLLRCGLVFLRCGGDSLFQLYCWEVRHNKRLIELHELHFGQGLSDCGGVVVDGLRIMRTRFLFLGCCIRMLGLQCWHVRAYVGLFELHELCCRDLLDRSRFFCLDRLYPLFNGNNFGRRSFKLH